MFSSWTNVDRNSPQTPGQVKEDAEGVICQGSHLLPKHLRGKATAQQKPCSFLNGVASIRLSRYFSCSFTQRHSIPPASLQASGPTFSVCQAPAQKLDGLAPALLGGEGQPVHGSAVVNLLVPVAGKLQVVLPHLQAGPVTSHAAPSPRGPAPPPNSTSSHPLATQAKGGGGGNVPPADRRHLHQAGPLPDR